MLAIVELFISSFSYFSFSFASFLGKFLQIYILNLSCSYFCYLIFSFYKLSFLLCIFHFYSIIQCLLLHYWKYLWHFGGGVVSLKSFYFLWFFKKSFLVLVFHFHGNHIPQLSSDSWFLITFKMRYWKADWKLCYKSEILHVGFTLKWPVKAFPWGVTQYQYLYVFSLGLLRFSKEICSDLWFGVQRPESWKLCG